MISVLTPSLEETSIYKKNKELLSKDSRISEFILDNSIGIGMARNRLLKKAKNKYILWIDSDIELLNNPINTFLEILEKNPDIASVCAVSEHIGKDWKTILEKTYHLAWERCMPEEYDACVRIFECALCRKTPFLNIGGFDSSFKFSGEDIDVYIKLNKRGFRAIRTKRVKALHHYNPEKFWDKMKNYKLGSEQVSKKYGNDYQKIVLSKLKVNFFKVMVFLFLYLREMKKPHYILLYPIWRFKRYLVSR